MALEHDLSYFKELASAGFHGAASVRRERQPPPSTPWLALSAPAAMGAALGAYRTHRFGRRNSPSAIAIGGLLGGLVGCGAAAAWSSRRLLRPAVRQAARNVQAVRDARWLLTHPIDYA